MRVGRFRRLSNGLSVLFSRELVPTQTVKLREDYETLDRKRWLYNRGVRALGIGFLIASLVPVPLPQADYHNIRHHDAPGEICVYHDHLLQWHPSANLDDDVAVLHWHWFVPRVPHQRGPSNEHPGPESGLAIHAHVGNLLESTWRAEQCLARDGRGQILERLTVGSSEASSAHLLHETVYRNRELNFSPLWDFGADALRAARTVLFQRWNC
jgi:hypothetical protein